MKGGDVRGVLSQSTGAREWRGMCWQERTLGTGLVALLLYGVWSFTQVDDADVIALGVAEEVAESPILLRALSRELQIQGKIRLECQTSYVDAYGRVALQCLRVPVEPPP